MYSKSTTEGDVTFQLFYSGGCKLNGWLKDWQVNLIKVKLEGCTYKISAGVDGDALPQRVQELQITVKNNTGDWRQAASSRKTIQAFSCSSDLAATMKIQAQIIQFYEDKYNATMQSDGRLTFATRARADHLTASIKDMPVFSAGETYGIYITKENESDITATFKLAAATSPSNHDTVTFLDLFNQVKKELEQALSDVQRQHPQANNETILYLAGQQLSVRIVPTWVETYSSKDLERMLEEGKSKDVVKQLGLNNLIGYTMSLQLIAIVQVIVQRADQADQADQAEPVFTAFKAQGFEQALSVANTLEDDVKCFALLTLARSCVDTRDFAHAERALALVPNGIEGKAEQVAYYRQHKTPDNDQRVQDMVNALLAPCFYSPVSFSDEEASEEEEVSEEGDASTVGVDTVKLAVAVEQAGRQRQVLNQS